MLNVSGDISIIVLLTIMGSIYTYIDEAVLCIKREKMQLQLTIKFQLITVFKSQRIFTSGKFHVFI